jgi:hypothetical protein
VAIVAEVIAVRAEVPEAVPHAMVTMRRMAAVHAFGRSTRWRERRCTDGDDRRESERTEHCSQDVTHRGSPLSWAKAPIALTCANGRRATAIAMCWRSPKTSSAMNARSDSPKFSSFVTRVTTRVPSIRDARHNIFFVRQTAPQRLSPTIHLKEKARGAFMAPRAICASSTRLRTSRRP